jgi:mRNA-degrading endonuclease RelE of RelBE toxin-antitoxin system
VNVSFTERFRRSYRDAPSRVRQTFDKQLAHLLRDHRHPSLRAKKYDAARGIWQARVNGGWRFYFLIDDDTYILLDIIPHPK